MTMNDRIAELTAELSQIEAAIKAVQSQEASSITIDGRTIIRPDVLKMRASRNHIITELNILKAFTLDEEPPLFKGANL